ncbi:type II toxin-antitoxin system HipA family toxin [Polaromonas sp. P2-4]|nr:type II toxin-antitoxin system HipA family toxin [Polaromonas sp. P2-4]
MNWPEKLKELHVSVVGQRAASLLKQSVYQLVYEPGAQRCVGLGLPPNERVFQDGDLFAALDMNLPEGYLFDRILDRFPKFALSKMHLLALMGSGGIGRLGYSLPGAAAATPPASVSRQDLLRGGRSAALFEELVNAYLGVGTALSGVQPKVMVPVVSKAIIPAPNVIVKAEGERYPGLCANEWMCLTAARCAGLRVPDFALSADARLLVIDRFDITPAGQRLGFEDIAAVMQLRVRDRLSSRKYIGSYEDVASALQLVCTDAPAALRQFFDYLALSVLLHNGDAHLKNFGVLYDEPLSGHLPGHAPRIWLSPLYDQVTTTLYTYERPGGIETVDHTMALKLRRGQRSGDKSPARSYPVRKELEKFGHDVCGVQNPSAVIEQLSDGMSQALQLARSHGSIAPAMYQKMEAIWDGARQGY